MSRLTEKIGYTYGVIACGKDCRYNHEYCNKMDECPALDEIVEKLGRYEDLFEKL